jgi:hypothetical protein
MDYASAVDSLRSLRAGADASDTPLNLLVLGRAAEALAPLSLEVGGISTWSVRGQSITKPSDLLKIQPLPGVKLSFFLAIEEGTSGTVNGTNLPSALRRAFTLDDLGPYVGPISMDFLRTLRGLWNEQIRKAAIVPDYVVDNAVALVSVGLVVTPVSDLSLGARWEAIVAAVGKAVKAYQSKALAEAAAEGRRLAADVAFWDTVYTVVETVRDAPALAVAAVTEAATGVAWSWLKITWWVWLLAAAALFVYLNRNKLAARAVEKATL